MSFRPQSPAWSIRAVFRIIASAALRQRCGAFILRAESSSSISLRRMATRASSSCSARAALSLRRAAPAVASERLSCLDDGRLVYRLKRRWRDGTTALVFALDELECPRCSSRMRIPAQIHPPDTTRAILDCLGLASRDPPHAPARAEPDPLPFPGHTAAD